MNKRMKKRLSWLLSFSLLSASVGIWSSGGMQAEAEGDEPVVKMLQNGDASGLNITYPTPATSYGPNDILYLVGVESELDRDAVTQGDLSGNSFKAVEKKAIARWKAVVMTSTRFEVTDWGDTTLTVRAGDKLANAIKVKGYKENAYDVISAILTPKNGGDIAAYGSIALIDTSSTSEDMEVGVTMPQDIPEGEYILHLYAETAGYYATNSQSKEIKVTGDTVATESPEASAEATVPVEPSVEPTAVAPITPIPTITETPVSPVTPVPTPTAVATLEPTKQPVPTNTPKPTDTPVPTKQPAQTNTSAPTNTPAVTLEPTGQPVQTQTPEPAHTAAATENPIHTWLPVPSNTPAAMTAAPRPVYTLNPVPSRSPGETMAPATEPLETMAPNEEENQVPEPGTTVKQEKVTYKVTEDGGVAVDKIGASLNQKEVTIPDTMVVDGQEYKVDTISAGAFAGNKKVEQVTLGENIKKIEKGAFKGCKNLKKVTLSNKVTTVGAKSFSGCTSLKTVALPDSVKKIGARAFKGCKSLKNITIGKAAKVKGGAVSAVPCIRTAKNGVVTVETVPVYSAGSSPALTIGNYAFAACSSMKKVIINSAVRVIGSSAFRGCKKLSDITVNSQILEKVRKLALKGINNCTITVPSNKFKPYRTLFRNKGQGKKVLIAKV